MFAEATARLCETALLVTAHSLCPMTDILAKNHDSYILCTADMIIGDICWLPVAITPLTGLNSICNCLMLCQRRGNLLLSQ